jgi:phage terminase Nu1 subunit (DNA packaging protein)
MSFTGRIQPRLVTKEGICAYLGDISAATYDKWQARGIVPGPVRGTNRYDVRAHSWALDRCSGIATAGARMSPLEQWEAEK